jgi:sulfoxide reductase heme-binding subunit YedZ
MNGLLSSALWYLGRGTGMTALLLLTLAVTLGIMTRSGRTWPGLSRFAVADLHQTASLTAACLLAVHVVSLLLDPIAQLRIVNVLVPFTGHYRPLYVGLGALALDLLLAIVATSVLRHRLGPRAFRLVHGATYAMWPLAFFHALGAGTDAGSRWFTTGAVACAVAVAVSLGWRTSRSFAGRGQVRIERSVPR